MTAVLVFSALRLAMYAWCNLPAPRSVLPIGTARVTQGDHDKG